MNTKSAENGLGLDFVTFSIIGVLIILLSMFRTNSYTRTEEYLGLSVVMTFFIANALNNNDYNSIKLNFDIDKYGPLIMRIIPIVAYIVTCLFIYSHDSSNYSKLNELIDQGNNQTLEEKLMEPGTSYWPIKVFAIDFVMLVLFGAIIWSIYLDNSGNGNYINYKSYIQYALIGSSLTVAGLTIGLSLPALDTLINEQTTDG